MRKSVIAVTAALVGVLMAAPMATAAQSIGDAKKACADIVEGRATYQTVTDGTSITGSEVLAQMDLGAEACKNVTYTMSVYLGDTANSLLTTTAGVPVAATAADPPRVQFAATDLAYQGGGLTDVVCIVITTSKSNGTVLDRAPDAGCIAVPVDSDVSGATRFR